MFYVCDFMTEVFLANEIMSDVMLVKRQTDSFFDNYFGWLLWVVFYRWLQIE